MSGYMRVIKTAAVQAVQQSFDLLYPAPDPAGGAKKPFVSVEYPVEEAQYPAIWVDFDPAELRTVGIAYTETDSSGAAYARWRFAGHVSFTLVALSSNERDLLYDQLVSLVAFAAQSDFPSQFRQVAENIPLVAVTWSFDSVENSPPSAAPGTPWGTVDIIYERGFSLQVIGEFVTDPYTAEIVPLSAIQVIATELGAPDVTSMIEVTS